MDSRCRDYVYQDILYTSEYDIKSCVITSFTLQSMIENRVSGHPLHSNNPVKSLQDLTYESVFVLKLLPYWA